MKLEVKYDKKADILYLHFSGKRATRSKELDGERSVDYSEDGEIRSIRFLAASSGVSTAGLPHRSAIERALSNNGFMQSTQPVKPSEALQKKPLKARILAFLWTSLAILIFAGSVTTSVILARSMFVLESLPGLVAALSGLVVAMFPTVMGCLILWLCAGSAFQKKARRPNESYPRTRVKTRTKLQK